MSSNSNGGGGFINLQLTVEPPTGSALPLTGNLSQSQGLPPIPNSNDLTLLTPTMEVAIPQYWQDLEYDVVCALNDVFKTRTRLYVNRNAAATGKIITNQTRGWVYLYWLVEFLCNQKALYRKQPKRKLVVDGDGDIQIADESNSTVLALKEVPKMPHFVDTGIWGSLHVHIVADYDNGLGPGTERHCWLKCDQDGTVRAFQWPLNIEVDDFKIKGFLRSHFFEIAERPELTAILEDPTGPHNLLPGAREERLNLLCPFKKSSFNEDADNTLLNHQYQKKAILDAITESGVPRSDDDEILMIGQWMRRDLYWNHFMTIVKGYSIVHVDLFHADGSSDGHVACCDVINLLPEQQRDMKPCPIAFVQYLFLF